MSQDYVSPPPIRGPVDEFSGGVALRVSQPWTAFFSKVFAVCFAVAQSGTSAKRPTVGLWVGRPYFDTTLGYSIWYDGTQWVDATGTTA